MKTIFTTLIVLFALKVHAQETFLTKEQASKLYASQYFNDFPRGARLNFSNEKSITLMPNQNCSEKKQAGGWGTTYKCQICREPVDGDTLFKEKNSFIRTGGLKENGNLTKVVNPQIADSVKYHEGLKEIQIKFKSGIVLGCAKKSSGYDIIRLPDFIGLVETMYGITIDLPAPQEVKLQPKKQTPVNEPAAPENPVAI